MKKRDLETIDDAFSSCTLLISLLDGKPCQSQTFSKIRQMWSENTDTFKVGQIRRIWNMFLSRVLCSFHRCANVNRFYCVFTVDLEPTEVYVGCLPWWRSSRFSRAFEGRGLPAMRRRWDYLSRNVFPFFFPNQVIPRLLLSFSHILPDF